MKKPIMRLLYILAAASTMLAGCVDPSSLSNHLVMVRQKDLTDRIKPRGFRGGETVHSNVGGTKIFVEEYVNGRGDIYVLSDQPPEVQIIRRDGHDRLYLDNDGNVIAWTNLYSPEVYTAAGKLLPLASSGYNQVEIDGSGKFFFAFNWETLHGYVAEFKSPSKVQFEFDGQPYIIWSSDDNVYLGLSSASGKMNETRCVRYERHGTWRRTEDIRVPGTVFMRDPWSDAVVISREGALPFIHTYSLFSLSTGVEASLPSGIPLFQVPVFLKTDWIYQHKGT